MPNKLQGYNLQTKLKRIQDLLDSIDADAEFPRVLIKKALDMDPNTQYSKIFPLTQKICWKISEWFLEEHVVGVVGDIVASEKLFTGKDLEEYLGVWDMSDDEWEKIEKGIKENWNSSNDNRVDLK